MAAFDFTQAVVALLGAVFVKIVYDIWRSYQFANFAKSNGCEEPLNISGAWPFSILDGWRRLRLLVETVKSGGDFIDDAFANQFDDANTVKVTMFDGTVGVFTIEPANLQALLATQFKVCVCLE